MAQHSNYAQDRDLMMEAYGSVEGNIPKTSSTALPHGYVLNEGHCSDEEHEGTEDTVKVSLELELDKETAEQLHSQLMDEVVPAEDSSCASNEEEHAEDGEHAESPFPKADHDAPEGGLGSRSMDEAEDGEGKHDDGDDKDEKCDYVPCEDGEHAEEEPGDEFFAMLDDVLMVTGTEDAHAVVAGLEKQLGRKLSPLETEHAHNVIQDDELPEDAEGHHSSGSDDGECDECGGDGCDVCKGSGEQDEEEIVAESYTSAYLERM